MGIADDILGPEGWHAALAALDWQVDLGVTEVVGDSALSAYDLPAESPRMPAARPAAEAPPATGAPSRPAFAAPPLAAA